MPGPAVRGGPQSGTMEKGERIGMGFGKKKRQEREAVGLYLHIPFCRSKCDYCDFYSLAGREDQIGRAHV